MSVVPATGASAGVRLSIYLSASEDQARLTGEGVKWPGSKGVGSPKKKATAFRRHEGNEIKTKIN